MIDQETRIQRIADLLAKTKETTIIPFRGATKEVKRITVPLDLLVYRLSNGRTRVEQLKYLSDNGKPANFFVNSQESEEAQEAQGSILLAMARDQRGNIYDELERVASQREPLMITDSGVIVNGNRRVAAMRDLFATTPSRYAAFKHIEVAVLPPDATEQDIEDIETELQETPETKLDYGWIARRLKIRYQIERLGMTAKELFTKYRLTKEDDINRELAQLSLAEDFLVFASHNATDYWIVGKSEEIFKRLQAAISSPPPEKAQLRKSIGFNLIKAGLKGDVEDRLYKYHPIFGDRLDRVLALYESSKPVALADASPMSHPIPVQPDYDDPLSVIESLAPISKSPVEKLLDDPEKAPVVIQELLDVFESVERERRDGDIRRKAERNSQSAYRLLLDIDCTNIEPTTLPAVKAQLNSLIATAQTILKNLPPTSESVSA